MLGGRTNQVSTGIKTSKIGLKVPMVKKSKPIILWIAGGRHFNQPYVLRKALVAFIARVGMPTLVIHGKCPTGADAIGDRVAKELGCKVKGFPADWKTHGLYAGPMRNLEMAQIATHGLMFGGGATSKGTRNSIALAKKFKVKNKVYRYNYEKTAKKTRP
jgi:hypothetical protein